MQSLVATAGPMIFKSSIDHPTISGNAGRSVLIQLILTNISFHNIQIFVIYFFISSLVNQMQVGD